VKSNLLLSVPTNKLVKSITIFDAVTTKTWWLSCRQHV